MSVESVMASNHLPLCCPPLLLPSVFPSIRVFSSESALCIRWPKYWSFSISPSNEYSGLISFRTDVISLLSKGLSSSPTPQFKSVDSSVLSFLYSPTLKTRILKCLAIPFSSGPRFVRTLHHDPSILGGPTWHGS